MHAALHGAWTGSLRSLHGDAGKLDVSIGRDSLLKVTLVMRADGSRQVIMATDVVLKGNEIHWTQDLAGTSCKATAVRTARAKVVPESIIGKLICSGTQWSFSLRKQTA